MTVGQSTHKWRNHHYIKDLELVLTIFTNHLHQYSMGQMSDFALPTVEISGFSDQYPARSQPYLIGSHIPSTISLSGHNSPAFYMHANSVPSCTFLPSLKNTGTTNTSSGLATLSTVSSDGSSSLERAASESTSKMSSRFTKCSRCVKTFRGKPNDQKKNLLRHELAVHSNSRVNCPFPTCARTFTPGRMDNIQRHMKSTHENCA